MCGGVVDLFKKISTLARHENLDIKKVFAASFEGEGREVCTPTESLPTCMENGHDRSWVKIGIRADRMDAHAIDARWCRL